MKGQQMNFYPDKVYIGIYMVARLLVFMLIDRHARQEIPGSISYIMKKSWKLSASLLLSVPRNWTEE